MESCHRMFESLAGLLSAHCYAETLSLRYGASQLSWTPANAAENVVLHPNRLNLPLHWKKPRRIFVNSMSDLFHEQVPDEFIDQVFGITTLTSGHTYQVLTKCPKRMLAYFRSAGRAEKIALAAAAHWPHAPLGAFVDMVAPRLLPLSDVWLGVSVENQRWADERIPILLETPAAVHFLSCEPLLGPLALRGWLPRLQWVIIGGESGQHMSKPQYTHRWMQPEWAQSIVDQCRAAGVPVFFKQASGSRQGMCPDLLGAIIQEWPLTSGRGA